MDCTLTPPEFELAFEQTSFKPNTDLVARATWTRPFAKALMLALDDRRDGRAIALVRTSTQPYPHVSEQLELRTHNIALLTVPDRYRDAELPRSERDFLLARAWVQFQRGAEVYSRPSLLPQRRD